MKHCGTIDFETERLFLRRFNKADLEEMFKSWASREEIQKEYGEPVYDTIAKAEVLLNKYIDGYKSEDFYRWAIVERKSGKNIGQIVFCRVYSDCKTAEIEYCIGTEYWGNGYAGEALEGVVDFTFKNTEFLKLEAFHREANVKSGRVLEKSKMAVTDNVERFKRENKEAVGEICYCIER